MIQSAQEKAQDVPRWQGRVADAQLDPLSESKSKLEGSHGLAPMGADLSADAVDAERQARRERALQAQREQDNQNVADSESEYESVCHADLEGGCRAIHPEDWRGSGYATPAV